ncbi:lipoate--protein ligase family protein [Leptospira alstonii]|uniref:Biotin/lipoate A/B protein ligase family protein n=2 Tax=Leptospira alstonii TaxID=28452 RepID=M6CQI9_9LEPT|nr:biotin/lipoate A/B protein ligase [Leptospira alstonii]EMJ92806.1 biotin/lipoate A/B protein ligase family protein [Leptospira alstonii serovar Sichuan str. 79601]EQA79016.1 biotin/lipoate A/B protein ligase family protein [Leptospira alstonii serovar Pingchang str. 80-412]
MRTFSFVQNSKRSAAYNLALEEAIGLHLVSSGYGAGLRIWKNPFSIVLGLSEKAEDTVLPEVLERFKRSAGNRISSELPNVSVTSEKNPTPFANQNSIWKNPTKTSEWNDKKSDFSQDDENQKLFDNQFPAIVRRASGGGTVVHHPEENLNFTFFISLEVKPELYKVKESYDYFLGLVVAALKRQTLDASFRGKSDLAILEKGLEKKISGNAQFRKKGAVVHHGTLILKSSLIERVSGLLKHPPEEPEYRKNRKHSDFVTSLPNDFSPLKFGRDLSHVFAESLGLSRMDTEPDLRFQKTVFKEAKQLLENKYSRMDFIFRD